MERLPALQTARPLVIQPGCLHVEPPALMEQLPSRLQFRNTAVYQFSDRVLREVDFDGDPITDILVTLGIEPEHPAHLMSRAVMRAVWCLGIGQTVNNSGWDGTTAIRS